MHSTRRLQRDLRELQQTGDLCSVAAQPVNGNLYLWHGNLSGLSGCILHIEMIFPNDYPMSPPKIRLLTSFKHPNVFGDYICLDMLKTDGWSSAYSVSSILRQLQTFLFAENVPQDYGGSRKNTMTARELDALRRSTRNFRCPTCEHTGNRPWPKFQIIKSTLFVPDLCKWESKFTIVPFNGTSKAGLVCDSQNPKNWVGFRAQQHIIIDGTDKSYFINFRIDRCVGVARVGLASTLDATHNLGTDDNSWGFGGTAKKSYDGIFSNYGFPYSKGDEVGMLINSKTGEIYFLVNTMSQGVAFTLGHGKYYPSLCMRNATITVSYPSKPTFLPGLIETPSPTMNITDIGVDMLNQVMSKLSVEDTAKMSKALDVAEPIIDPTCFCLGESMEKSILCMGINVQKYRDGNLKFVSVKCIDPFSFEAYDRLKLRRDPYNVRFEYALPMALCGSHFVRALPHLKNLTTRTLGFTVKPRRMIIDVITNAMNGIVVELNNQCGGVTRLLSEKSLLAYGHLHHLLLLMANRLQETHAMVEESVNKARQGLTDKKNISNLGTFLACFAISPTKWKEVRSALMRELFTRNVLWVIERKVRVYKPDQLKVEHLQRIYKEGKTSWQLFMFYKWFATNVVVNPNTISDYNRRRGQLPKELQDELFSVCKRISRIGGWNKFFEFIGEPPKSNTKLIAYIKQCMRRSKEKGYTK